jgi:L-ribulokinase
VEGICGYVKDGVIPGYYTYEAGQSAVGDVFDWFVKNCVPASYTEEAKEKNTNIHKLLREKASKLKVGESRLLALDWLNGNRSILVNANLTGVILGLTLQTKPEEIYRALIEATAYGTRVIVEQYQQNGIEIKSICAAGGIAQKDEMMMQIYADVLNREIRIAGSTQAGALGSAIYASVAAGIYPDVKSAAEKMSQPYLKVYKPDQQNHKAYSKLYAEYKRLHDYFGKGENRVMELFAEISL